MDIANALIARFMVQGGIEYSDLFGPVSIIQIVIKKQCIYGTYNESNRTTSK